MVEKTNRFRFLFLLSAILLISLNACVFQGSYQPLAIPLRVLVNSSGEISLEASTEFVTPLGIFSLGVASDSIRFFDTVRNTLLIRTNSYDCLYDLRGNNFEIQFEQGLSVRRLQKDSQNNIFLELEGNFSGCQQDLPQVASYSPAVENCSVPYNPSLSLGQKTSIAVFQVSVRTGPSADYDLVRNKYLKKGRGVTLLEGPVCGPTRSGGNSWWWKLKSEELRLSSGEQVVIVGWVAEKDADTALLDLR
jgi:hypothetical protein